MLHKDAGRLAVPAIVSGIAEPLIDLVVTAFVGQLRRRNGTAADRHIEQLFPALWCWVLAQTRSAVLSVVAKCWGEQRLDERSKA
ncbi:MAG: hypothetical protein IPN85_18735 [Flavobacteriales bacterium]|nr:hypothetical protein [Flavobacteriales bacterium]